tara:strand:+ start:2306 stop:3454 length:1149 start_codon:yes stop_codon:yes gene_type:complete
MAEYDIVAARTNALANLIRAFSPLLEPSHAEKQADLLAAEIERQKALHQLQMDHADDAKALRNREAELDLTMGLDQWSAEFRPEEEGRFGFDLIALPGMKKQGNPGEVVRSFWNPKRWIAGSHDGMVNALTVAWGGPKAIRGAVKYGGPQLYRINNKLFNNRWTTGAKLKEAQRQWAKQGLKPGSFEWERRTRIFKKIDVSQAAAGKLTQGQKNIMSLMEKMSLSGAVAKTGWTTGKQRALKAAMLGGGPVAGYSAPHGIFFDKNPNAEFRNSYFKPTVVGDMFEAYETKLKRELDTIKFNRKQGVPLTQLENAWLVKAKKFYSQSNNPYLNSEIYVNWRAGESLDTGYSGHMLGSEVQERWRRMNEEIATGIYFLENPQGK